MQLWAAPQEALGLLVGGWQEYRIIYLWTEYMGITAREQMQLEAMECGQHFCLASRRSAPMFRRQVAKTHPSPGSLSCLMDHCFPFVILEHYSHTLYLISLYNIIVAFRKRERFNKGSSQIYLLLHCYKQ